MQEGSRRKGRNMRLHLITAEDQLTLKLRARELIRFPQLTMPLLAALTPSSWNVTHTDEITRAVDTRQHWDVVGITAATPGAPHAYDLAQAFRKNGARVVMGGPHATLLPYEAAQHVDVVVAGEAESVWPRVLRDIERETRYAVGRHLLDVRTGANVEALPVGSRIYRCPTPAALAGHHGVSARRRIARAGGGKRLQGALRRAGEHQPGEPRRRGQGPQQRGGLREPAAAVSLAWNRSAGWHHVRLRRRRSGHLRSHGGRLRHWDWTARRSAWSCRIPGRPPTVGCEPKGESSTTTGATTTARPTSSIAPRA
jgi:hypothetical protein